MAIVGGAVLPPATGLIADYITGSAGLHSAFLLPMVAYALICGFAVMAARAHVSTVGETAGNANRLRERAAFSLVCGAEFLLRRRKRDTHFWRSLAGRGQARKRGLRKNLGGMIPPRFRTLPTSTDQ